MRSKKSNKLKIVILGPDGAGKSSVIHGLIRRFDQAGRVVTMRYLKPDLVFSHRGEATVNAVPHGKPSRSALSSLAKILVWLMEEWYANLIWDKKGTLLICDRYYHDLLVDPKRYRYGGPAWAAKLVGKLMPQPKLWILLDASAEVLQARKQEVTIDETARQRYAYSDFVRKQRKYVIVDASQSLGRVIADTQKAITENL
jgi:thymidylate kinase